MYAALLLIHSLTRWLIVIALGYVFGRSLAAWRNGRPYGRTDDIWRASTIGICHTQLIIGYLLYFAYSPVTKYFVQTGSFENYQAVFFGVYHIALMTIAILVASVGGALVKRAADAKRQHQLTVIYFGTTLLLVLGGIPWFRRLLF